MPTFSVIIPTYNSAKYISETIRSILNQTFQDFEIVVVDDGSTDETLSIVSQFEKVRYITQQHKERAAARNRGIREALGQYIAFLDADDLWLPNKLETDYAIFRKNDDISAIHSDAIVINDCGKRVGKRFSNEGIQNFKDDILVRNPLITSAVCIKRECFKTAGEFNENIALSGSEDWEMWVRLSREFIFAHNKNFTVCYRQNNASAKLACSIEHSTLTALGIILSSNGTVKNSFFKKRITAHTHATIALNFALADDKRKALRYINSAMISFPKIILDKQFISALIKIFIKIKPASKVFIPGDGIAMVISNYDTVGGLQTQAKILSEEFQRRGLKVFILTRNYLGLKAKENSGNVYVRRFSFNPKYKILSSIYYLCASVSWLYFHRKKFKVIQCFQLASPLNIGVLAKFFTGTPVVVRLSGTGKLGDVYEMQKLPLSAVRKFFIGFVDRFIILNKAMEEELSVYLKNDSSNKIVFIPNGVKINRESAFDENIRKKYRKKLKSEYAFLATYVGRLTQGKGLHDLLYSWKEIRSRIPDAHLALLGKGGLFKNIEQELKSLAADLNIDDVVHFIGEVSCVSDYLLASDIFVLPSMSEGISNAILEAMSCGNIIVTTKIPANLAMLNSANSILIEPGNRRELLHALVQVLNNPARYYELGRQAKEAAFVYSAERIGEEYMHLYGEIL